MKEDPVSLHARIQQLEYEKIELYKKVIRLSEEIAFLRVHKTLQAGITGETIIVISVKGAITAYGDAYDVDIAGQRLEVKFANLKLEKNGTTRLRWAWYKVLGEGGEKNYDYLVLVGEKDEKWRESYSDAESPYVFFCIPRSEIARLSSKSGKYRGIWLGANPNGQRYSAFRPYEMSIEKLREVFPELAQ